MHRFSRVLFLLTAPAFLLCARSGDQPPATMLKAVVRLSGPNIKAGSQAALPKTIYRAGPHFARIEDPPNAREQMQKLTIIAEPDAYSVNLIDKKGTHAIDQGGADDLHLPVVFDPTGKLKSLNKLEFGEEFDFFEKSGASQAAGPIVNAKPTDAYKMDTETGSALLVVKAGTHVPIKLTWETKDGPYTYEFITYEEVPFDASLFTRPAGVTYREIPPDPGIEKEKGR